MANFILTPVHIISIFTQYITYTYDWSKMLRQNMLTYVITGHSLEGNLLLSHTSLGHKIHLSYKKQYTLKNKIIPLLSIKLNKSLHPVFKKEKLTSFVSQARCALKLSLYVPKSRNEINSEQTPS